MWRNSYIRPRLAGIDGRVIFVLALTMFHMRLWTLEMTGIVAGTLALMELWFGITPEVAWRKMRSMVAGRRRPGTLKDRYRRAVDYGMVEYNIARRKLNHP